VAALVPDRSGDRSSKWKFVFCNFSQAAFTLFMNYIFYEGVKMTQISEVARCNLSKLAVEGAFERC